MISYGIKLQKLKRTVVVKKYIEGGMNVINSNPLKTLGMFAKKDENVTFPWLNPFNSGYTFTCQLKLTYIVFAFSHVGPHT